MQNFSSLASVVQKLRGVCSQSTPPGMGCDESPPGIGLKPVGIDSLTLYLSFKSKVKTFSFLDSNLKRTGSYKFGVVIVIWLVSELVR